MNSETCIGRDGKPVPYEENDTERVREKTTTHILRTTCLRRCRRYRAVPKDRAITHHLRHDLSAVRFRLNNCPLPNREGAEILDAWDSLHQLQLAVLGVHGDGLSGGYIAPEELLAEHGFHGVLDLSLIHI